MLKHVIAAALFLMLAAAPTASAAQANASSIWDGVYTQEQADRGKKVNAGVCAKCHGVRGDGANEPDQPGGPAIARFTFLAKWENSTIASLYEFIKTTMPPDNPASRTDQEYIDVIAHLLALSGAPAGDVELPIDPDVLGRIYIKQKSD